MTTDHSEDLSVAGLSKNVSDAIQQEQLTDSRPNAIPRKTLAGLNVGISISDSSELDGLGYSPMHLQDAMIEFARYFLVHGANLVYGGDLRKDGYTYMFSELAKLYSSRGENPEERVINYFAWPVHLRLTKKQELDWKYKVKLQKLNPPVELGIDNKTFLNPDTVDNCYVWSRNLSHMREEISRISNCRVLLGGAMGHFMGRMPGVIEEALLGIRSRKPLYLIGVYGGATSIVIRALLGEKPIGQIEQHPIGTDFKEKYEELLRYIQQQDLAYSVDYKQIEDEFEQYGMTGLCAINGLTKDENMRLFFTPHLPEMIYLVFKGLMRVYNP